MELAGETKRIIIDEICEPKYKGGLSSIYFNNDLLVKVFHVIDGKSTSILNEKDFDVLKAIKHDNFIDLKERYHLNPQTSENVEAYSYKEVEGENYNLLYRDTEFVIDQFRNILSLFDVFSEYGVKTGDVRASNTLVLSNTIVLIDPDFFHYEGPSNNLRDFNRHQFLYLVLSYFFSLNGGILPDIITGSLDASNPMDGISKKLKPYKRPIDYITRQ